MYIKEETKTVKETAGYNTTSTTGVESVRRYICDDPLVLTPKIDQKREVPGYLEKTQKQISDHIEVIVKNLNPIA